MKHYTLTLMYTDNSVIDTTQLSYNATLSREEVLKLVRVYLQRIGYHGKRFKFSLKTLKNKKS